MSTCAQGGNDLRTASRPQDRSILLDGHVRDGHSVTSPSGYCRTFAALHRTPLSPLSSDAILYIHDMTDHALSPHPPTLSTYRNTHL